MKDEIPSSDTAVLQDKTAKLWSDEETLVADVRGTLSPSQMVEQKLIGRMNSSPLLVSHIERRLKPGPR